MAHRVKSDKHTPYKVILYCYGLFNYINKELFPAEEFFNVHGHNDGGSREIPPRVRTLLDFLRR